MLMHIANLVKIPCYLLVIIQKQKYGCISGKYLCKNLTKFALPDLLNVNAYSKFGENPLLFTQVIVRKRKYRRVSGR